MNSDYGLTIFSLKYEYIVFNFGRVTISRVPIQTSFQEVTSKLLLMIHHKHNREPHHLKSKLHHKRMRRLNKKFNEGMQLKFHIYMNNLLERKNGADWKDNSFKKNKWMILVKNTKIKKRFILKLTCKIKNIKTIYN